VTGTQFRANQQSDLWGVDSLCESAKLLGDFLFLVPPKAGIKDRLLTIKKHGFCAHGTGAGH